MEILFWRNYVSKKYAWYFHNIVAESGDQMAVRLCRAHTSDLCILCTQESPSVYNFISICSTDLHSLICINHNFVNELTHNINISFRMFFIASLSGWCSTLHLSYKILLFGIWFTMIQIQLKFVSSAKKETYLEKWIFVRSWTQCPKCW